MKNQLLLFALGICPLLLTACSSSDEAPANTQTVVNVSNQTTSSFSQVSIEEHLSGKVFEAKPFSCPARQNNCKFYYTGAKFTGPAVAIFKDSQGHIVGIYDVDHAPGNYMAPEVTLWSTGAYLYEALVNVKSAFGSMTEAERQAVLSVFVSDKRAADRANVANISAETANQLTHYEALALNFLNQQITGPLTVSAYVQNLAQRLSQREVAPRAEFSTTNSPAAVSISSIFNLVSNRLKSFKETDLIRTAHATTPPPCGKDSKFTVALFQGMAASIPSSFPVAAVVAKTTSSLVAAACNDTGAKLDDILDKLNVVKNSLNNLTTDLNKLAQFIANNEANSILQEFTNVSEDLSRLAENYQIILGNSKVASIKEYVHKFGGRGTDALSNILQAEPDGIFANLLKRAFGAPDQNYLLQIERLTENNFDSLRAALDLLCKNPESGDVVEARVRCNLIISSSTSRLIAAQTIAFQLASETYNLLSEYPSEATRYAYESSKTPAQHTSELRDKLNKQADKLVSTYTQTVINSNGGIYYDTQAGLPLAMLTNIRGVNCSGTPEHPDSNVASISGWVKEPGGDEFLIMNCKNSTIPILSRYYIKTSGVDTPGRDSVINILGVPIPSTNKNLWTDKLGSTDTETFKMLAMRHADQSPRPLSFAFNGQNLRENTPSVVTDIDKSGPTGRLQEWAKPWNNDILKASGLTLFNLPFGLEERVNHWMRFTDDSGYSYAFSLESVGAPRYELSRMYLNCATVDCSTGQKFEGNLWWAGLNFKKGPQNLSLRNAESPYSARFPDGDRQLYGWIIGVSFIDAQ